MNDSIKKALNILFRTVIFCCFIVCIVMIKKFVDMYGDAITDDKDIKINKAFITTMGSYASLFKGLFFAGIAAVILSVVTGRFKASAAAVFFRTVLIASVLFLMSGALNVCDAIVDVSNVVEDLEIDDIDDLKSIDDDILTDAGIDDDRADEMSKAFKDEDAVVPFVITPFAAVLVYFILSMTSLHNLVKKTPQGVQCGGCEDARRVEMYDPNMFNGGNHYAQPQQPINPMAMNRMNAVPPVAQNPYVQNIINAANAVHPPHDHHDSAAIHDLEADGEFHNYAQAEADMRDDSSDYLSQLQNEENRGHRVTDEDFM